MTSSLRSRVGGADREQRQSSRGTAVNSNTAVRTAEADVNMASGCPSRISNRCGHVLRNLESHLQPM